MIKRLLPAFLLLLLFSCDKKESRPQQPPLFKMLSSEESGIDFNNEIIENDSIHVLDNYYIYNGGGVGIGDFNKDGNPDVVFAGNMVASKIYLNTGNLTFKDITDQTIIQTEDWMSGVNVADLDGNGWDDIYFSSGVTCEFGCQNLLFMNKGVNENGIPVFKEQGELAGLSDQDAITQTAFFDYDQDGDLDAYLLKNVVDGLNKNVIKEKGYFVKMSHTEDRLYRNNGLKDGVLSFTDVSEEAGIVYGGYGLGIAVSDLNQDGWPDLYIANDFAPNDLMYINQKDGTFKDMAPQMTKHQSFNGMGCDIADINNDGQFDIMVMDMLPEDNKRQKTMLMGANENQFRSRIRAGYQPQFMRNTLQVGNGTVGDEMLPYSEVAQMAGVNKTDWSWAPLMTDFNNDGLRDIYISNGYVRDMTDLDFISNKKFALQFGTEEAKFQKLKEMYNKLDGAYLSNYMYMNEGNLSFTDVTKDWGLSEPSFTQGTAFADFDGDGDLDLVTNNINKKAFVIENKSNELSDNNFIRLKLNQKGLNPAAFGAKVVLYQQNTIQTHYHSTVRGYLSTVENTIHFGLGKSGTIDSIQITWPGGGIQSLVDVQPNQTLEVSRNELQLQELKEKQERKTVFSSTQVAGLVFTHQENNQNDFAAQPLILNMYSQKGPVMVSGNVSLVPYQDLFIGNSKGFESTVLRQDSNGVFVAEQLTESKEFEDSGALFFDKDGDGDDDLYIVSGGAAYQSGHINLGDRLYRNDEGVLKLEEEQLLPAINVNGTVVKGADIDKDGDIDLFVGGGVVLGQYPNAEKSQLLINTNGAFKMAEKGVFEEISKLGIVNDAIWDDFDKDGWVDLIIVGEWSAVTFYRNDSGKLKKVESNQRLDNAMGWWNTIRSADLDGDGDEDYIVGNVGRNTPFEVKEQLPLELYVKDFDNNGTDDPVFSTYLKDTTGQYQKFPYHPLLSLSAQLNVLKSTFRKHEKFAVTPLEDIFTRKLLKEADHYQLNYPYTSVIINEGNGKFSLKPLPSEAQLSIVQTVEAIDYDKDGDIDIVLAGNFKASETMGGWYDASLGALMENDGKGNFSFVSNSQSGLLLDGQVKALKTITLADGSRVLLATETDGELSVYAY